MNANIKTKESVATLRVQIRRHKAMSVCRLCSDRNQFDEPLFKLWIEGDNIHRGYYCSYCYSYLILQAKDLMPGLRTVELGDEISVEVPEVLVRDGDPLRIFHPEDEIDRGLHMQRADAWHEKMRGNG
jgi:hypothetical protein